jgi:ribosomal protein S18 acetylase RimI-like enzyme
VLAQLVSQPDVSHGLRPFNPLRDLGQVADLMEEAFSEQQPFTGGEVIAEMRRWATRAPLLALLGQDALMAGFVWERDGRIVGNVHVTRIIANRDDWLISNVAVQRALRRRGIARELVSAALEQVAMRSGECAALQVNQQNEGAIHLYERLGFQTFHNVVELCRGPGAGEALSPGSVETRHYAQRDHRQVRSLFQRMVPPDQRRFMPLMLNGAHLAQQGRWENWLSDLMDKRRTRRLVVSDGQRIVGFMGAQAKRDPIAYHRLFVAIHPSKRGELERTLVGLGARWLDRYPSSSTLVSVPAANQSLLDELARAGFTETRRLQQMLLRIQR